MTATQQNVKSDAGAKPESDLAATEYPLEDLVTFLEASAFVTWDRIVEGGGSDIAPREEGITADLLSALRASFGRNEFYVKPYTAREEGGPWSSNADWEWWAERDGRWLGMRFQAKLIDFASGEYAHADVLQAVRLIENRFWSGPEHPDEEPVYRYPLFCLYTAWDTPDLPVRRRVFRRAYGYSVVPAPVLLPALLNGPADLDAIAPHLMPLAWLFERGVDPKHLRAKLRAGFSGGARGDRADEVYRAPEGTGNDAEAKRAARAEFERTPRRVQAATTPQRVLPPPEGRDIVRTSELPAYVQAAIIDADWQVPGGAFAGFEDDPGRPDDLDAVVLSRELQ